MRSFQSDPASTRSCGGKPSGDMGAMGVPAATDASPRGIIQEPWRGTLEFNPKEILMVKTPDCWKGSSLLKTAVLQQLPGLWRGAGQTTQGWWTDAGVVSKGSGLASAGRVFPAFIQPRRHVPRMQARSAVLAAFRRCFPPQPQPHPPGSPAPRRCRAFLAHVRLWWCQRLMDRSLRVQADAST